jgi:outer membrane protein assembly factor BamB
MRRLFLSLPIVCLLAAAAPADDWNQWRGPNRDGIVQSSPPLATTWPEAGPPRLWQSEEKIIGDANKAGGFGSVVVVGGRLYVYSSPKRSEPITTRTLPAAGLVSLGWTAKKPPDDLLAAVEAARVCDERLALKDNKQVAAWIAEWSKQHLTDAAAKKEFGPWINDRLLRGKAAIDMALLDKLSDIKEKQFESAAAVEKWLDANSVQGEVRKLVISRFPATTQLGDDAVHCLDAATGKTVWKQSWPSAAAENGASCTPCVVDGKCYVIGADSAVYCLDAGTGQRIWDGKAGTGAKHCSFIVIDGMAIIPAGPLTAFDAKTGQVRWTNDKIKATVSSPAGWHKDGKGYVIIRDNAMVSCVDVATGTIAWQEKDNVNGASPAVSGDYLAIWHGYDGALKLYQLAADKPKLLWTVPVGPDYGASPTIFDGKVYAIGANGWACVDIATGQPLMKEKTPRAGSYASPVFVDGKVLIQGGESGYGDGSLAVFTHEGGKGVLLAKAKINMLLCTTPALVDGLLYCRLNNYVACYDMRKK